MQNMPEIQKTNAKCQKGEGLPEGQFISASRKHGQSVIPLWSAISIGAIKTTAHAFAVFETDL